MPRGWILAGVALGGAVASAAAFWGFTVDDSWITYRYAVNLAEGHGLTWNPGDPPVEGYTNFLWVLLLAFGKWVMLDPLPVSKVLGVASTAGALFCAARVAGGFAVVQPAAIAVLTMVWLALTPQMGMHAVSGMETAWFTFLVTLWVAQWVSTRRVGAVLALNALALGLTRPDGNLIPLVTVATAMVLDPTVRERRILGPLLLFYALPGALYFAARVGYFGHLLPLPFQVKVLSDLPGPSGVATVLAFAKHHALALLLASVGVAMSPRRTWPAWIALAAFVAFYLVPRHIMGYGFRFLVPVLPSLVALACAGASGVLARRELQDRWGVGLVALLLLLQGGVLGRSWPSNLELARDYSRGLEAAHLTLARHLRAVDDTGIRLVAVEDAGAIPYVSGWRGLDLLGLNDESIAYGGFQADQVLLRQPDAVVLVSRRADPYVPWEWDNDDLHAKLLDSGYRTAGVVTFDPRYHLHVLAPPGAVHDALAARLPEGTP